MPKVSTLYDFEFMVFMSLKSLSVTEWSHARFSRKANTDSYFFCFVLVFFSSL